LRQGKIGGTDAAEPTTYAAHENRREKMSEADEANDRPEPHYGLLVLFLAVLALFVAVVVGYVLWGGCLAGCPA
jgi:hypothetical protein